MISHVVCFKMKPFAQGRQKRDNLITLKEKLENLKVVIPQVKALQVGFNERGGEYDAVAVMLFDSKEDLNIYDNNPDHIAIKKYIGEVCFNMEIIDYSF